MSFETIDREALTAWVHASCARQGVPVKITNPVVIANIATILTGNRDSARAEHRPATGIGGQVRHSGRIRSGSTEWEPGLPGRIVA